MNNLYREEAIPFIAYNPKDSSYKVDETAAKILSSIQGPIAVIAVAGLYRTGKSYLLNRMLLDRQDGFGVGNTINACTKGLWIWGTPLKGSTPDGKPINILVVDSEGIGSLEEDSQHDTKVFSLAILASSCFIYNSLGSIDENAIQNLSLVVNLTKHIALKNNSDDVDSEDYAQYFPSFFWIVRDFTLELVDSEGDSITSKDYLELALSDAKGFSDSVEQKNRIRRLLRTFFKERDCFTMIRPLLDEENLQNLNIMNLNSLRPEFQTQVLNLRNKILYKIRPKCLNDKPLNGQQYVTLLEQYVDAINNGAVPNIENAWTQLCRVESIKALDQSQLYFEQQITEQILPKIPFTEFELKNAVKQIKEMALEMYRSKAMGDVVKEYEKDLLARFKTTYNDLKFQNDIESQKLCNMFIQQQYQSIESKLHNNLYQSFNEFERELKLFQNFLIEHGPQTVNNQLYYQNFINTAMKDGAQHFTKNLEKEIQIANNLQKELQQKYSDELQEAKQNIQKERQSLFGKLQQANDQKEQFEKLLAKMKEENQKIISEKNKLESVLKNQVEVEKSQMQKLIDQLKNDLNQSQDKMRDNDRNLRQKTSDFEREKALLSKRQEHQDLQIEEQKETIKKLESQLSSLKNDQNSKFKDIQLQNEMIMKQQSEKIKDQVNQILDLQDKLQKIENDFIHAQNMADTQKKSLTSALMDANNTIAQLKSELNMLKQQEMDESKDMKNKYENIVKDLKARVQFLETDNQNKENSLKSTRGTLEKDNHVLKQKIQFLELQLQDVTQQLKDTKKAHDQTLDALSLVNPNDNANKLDMKTLQEIQEKYMEQIKQLGVENDRLKKVYQQNLESTSDEMNQQLTKLKDVRHELDIENKTLREQLQTLQLRYTQLENDYRDIENQKGISQKQIEEKYQLRMRRLEQEFEELKEKHEQEKLSLQAQAEDSVAQLKNFYDSERLQFEERINMERQQAKRRYDSMTDDYENRIREEQEKHEEEVDGLKNEQIHLEQLIANQQQQYEHELELRNKHIEQLEERIKELKIALANAQQEFNIKFESQGGSFDDERKNLNTKIENLQSELAKQDKENVTLQQQLEQARQNYERASNDFEKNRQEFQVEKSNIQQEVDQLRKKYQQVNDDYIEKQIIYEKNKALDDQQIQFLQNKLKELQDLLESQNSKSDDKIKQLKSDISNEFEARLKRSEEEIQSLQQKYDQLKKKSKENDLNNQRRIAELEREKAVTQEKAQNLDSKLNDQGAKYSSDVSLFTTQINQLKKQVEDNKKPLEAEIEKYKALISQLESDKNELISQYDRDKTLWENKFHFLETLKNQAKQDLVDANKKFEQTLEHLKRVRGNEQNSQNEQLLQESIINMERKYQQKLNEVSENNNRIIQEYEDKNKKLEKELKTINEKIKEEQLKKLGNNVVNEKKMNDLIENERKLMNDIQNLKQERDKIQLEQQKFLDAERQKMKDKINEVELKLKESEMKKSQLLFEHEKEKARWNLEKDRLNNEKIELQENFNRLDQKKELLLRENEKLKNEIKTQKRIGNTQMQLGSSSLGMGGMGGMGMSRGIDNYKRSPSQQKIMGNFLKGVMDGNGTNFQNYTSQQNNNPYELSFKNQNFDDQSQRQSSSFISNASNNSNQQ